MSSTMSTPRGACQRRSAACIRPFGRSAAHSTVKPVREAVLCWAAEPETTTASEAAPATAPQEPSDDSWIPVIKPEDLPKGVRKEVTVDGQSLLLFWYRNQIYAISSRSPAEGAYSEGFIKAKFTQDYGIICPTTGSVFSLKDGSILDWYPTNPILRSITPPTGKLPIYPVKLAQDSIQVSLEGGTAVAPTRGGADTSLESNNVFAVQPTVYVEGTEAAEVVASETKAAGGGGSSTLSTALTFTVAISAFGIVATAGTATALYYEDFILLGGFWAFMLAVGGFFAFQYNQQKNE
eukprot:jgi/Ulvmu1/6557/UM003_0193.1